MKKILIVDDYCAIRELLTETLKSGNYQIFGCENGRQAIELAQAERPDLIIMDIMMPGGLDGLEAVRRIKSDPKTKNCAVFFLTARGQVSDMKKGFQAGADGYFVKPFSPWELMTRVENILGD